MFSVYNTLYQRYSHEYQPKFELTFDDIQQEIRDNQYSDTDVQFGVLHHKPIEHNTGQRTRLNRLIRVQEVQAYLHDTQTDTPHITRIPVTIDHIRAGEPTEPGYCPLALAIEDVIPQVYPSIADIIRLDADAPYYKQYNTSVSTSIFTSTFDNEEPVVPGELILGRYYVWFIQENDETPFDPILRAIANEASA